MFFGVWMRKKSREELGKDLISEKSMSPWSDGCLRLFIAPCAFFEAAAIVGPPTAIQGPPASNGF